MTHGSSTWTIDDLSQAMAAAIFQGADSRLLKQNGDVLKFNGFWRNGDKQNVCAWLDKATWHDAKTGDGGGCKEFAKVAFNATLPEFMQRFGSFIVQQPSLKKQPVSTPPILVKNVKQIFSELLRNDKTREDLASHWLEHERGVANPRSCIGSEFTNLAQSDLNFFDKQHHSFIQQRVSAADQIVVPLRNPHSEDPQNLFFRSVSSCAQEDKSRLLPNAGGWQEPDGTPRAFGFPHLINEFPNLVICEGMADYFAAELLLDCDHNVLPIGVASASALPKWAKFLADSHFAGNAIIVFHLDQDKNGNLSDNGVGQDNAIKCANHLNSAGIRAKLFPWLKFLRWLNNFTDVRDLADVLKLDTDLERKQTCFLHMIREVNNG